MIVGIWALGALIHAALLMTAFVRLRRLSATAETSVPARWHAEAARLYEAQTSQAFPLSAADFAEVISAEYMVYGRKGIGGPQLAEVNRMLADERDKVAAQVAWLKAPRGGTF